MKRKGLYTFGIYYNALKFASSEQLLAYNDIYTLKFSLSKKIIGIKYCHGRPSQTNVVNELFDTGKKVIFIYFNYNAIFLKSSVIVVLSWKFILLDIFLAIKLDSEPLFYFVTMTFTRSNTTDNKR